MIHPDLQAKLGICPRWSAKVVWSCNDEPNEFCGLDRIGISTSSGHTEVSPILDSDNWSWSPFQACRRLACPNGPMVGHRACARGLDHWQGAVTCSAMNASCNTFADPEKPSPCTRHARPYARFARRRPDESTQPYQLTFQASSTHRAMSTMKSGGRLTGLPQFMGTRFVEMRPYGDLRQGQGGSVLCRIVVSSQLSSRLRPSSW